MGMKSVAIDGPSGAGKSTLARRLAQELGFCYVDTGAIYRTVGLFALREGVVPGDAPAVTALLERLEVGVAYGGDGFQRMLLNGEDVTQAIRKNEVSAAASQVSAIPAVRSALLEMQRKLAREHNVVMDGRDIGTVVLPQADVKIYLTASAEERAARRCRELLERGERVDQARVLAEIQERDRRDMNRETAPLKKAEGAVEVDTTGIGLEESLRRLVDVVRENLKACGVGTP